MIICGIDYSLTSPAITVHDGKLWDINNCKFYYMVPRKKQVVTTEQFFGTLYPEYSCDMERYNNLASWSANIINGANVQLAAIEGYAFGAVGRVFQIAENAGLLKYNIWKAGIPMGVYPPSEIKKHATGKGNADKEAMYEAFLAETSLDIREEIGIVSKTQWNPLSDIVDSYYIAKLGFLKENGDAHYT